MTGWHQALARSDPCVNHGWGFSHQIPAPSSCAMETSWELLYLPCFDFCSFCPPQEQIQHPWDHPWAVMQPEMSVQSWRQRDNTILTHVPTSPAPLPPSPAHR